MRPSSQKRCLGVFLAGALAVSACSDSDDRSGDAAADTSSTTVTTAAPVETSTSVTTTAASTTTATRPPSPAASPTSGPTRTTVGPERTVVAPAPLDPAELNRMVDELVAAETALRDPATPENELPGLARQQQAVYRSISARPSVLPQVQERVPEPLRPVVDANVTAGAELRALTKPRTELPPWRILPPPPAAELEGYYREAEERYGVPWAYLAAVHLVETRMGRIRGTSTAGAKGPMQFLPSTWERWGEGGDIEDPHDAILAAARYLKATGAPGDMAKALYAYNHSDRYVRAVTLYAQQMEGDQRAYLAYYQWQVYYIMTEGDVLLEEGYG